MDNQSFSDTKLSQAKRITKSSCLTSEQVKRVTKSFDFEDTRLEYAKYAYDYCYAKNNYWKVSEAFDFDSSVNSLNSYVDSK